MQLLESSDSLDQHGEGHENAPLESRGELEGEPKMTDSELFIRMTFVADPAKGCEILFRHYHKALCSHAVRFVYSRELAQDLVADVFLKFWKNKSYLSINTSYRYYLFRSVRNEALNYLRLEFRETEEIDAAAFEEGNRNNRPDKITEFEEVRNRMETLVKLLSPQCQRVFVLNRFEGKRYQEIADELNISIKTVEVHIGKALGILRKGLKDHLFN